MALQSHSSTSWEIQVLKSNRSLRKLLSKNQVSSEDDALFQKKQKEKKGGVGW